MLKICSTIRLFRSTIWGSAIALATISLTASKTLPQTPRSSQNHAPQTGCLSGYPDGTYRGDRPVTRYEFAAGLNSCLEQINQQIPQNRENLATQEDLEVLMRRQRQLNEQLRELNGRVNEMSNEE